MSSRTSLQEFEWVWVSLWVRECVYGLRSIAFRASAPRKTTAVVGGEVVWCPGCPVQRRREPRASPPYTQLRPKPVAWWQTLSEPGVPRLK